MLRPARNWMFTCAERTAEWKMEWSSRNTLKGMQDLKRPGTCASLGDEGYDGRNVESTELDGAWHYSQEAISTEHCENEWETDEGVPRKNKLSHIARQQPFYINLSRRKECRPEANERWLKIVTAAKANCKRQNDKLYKSVGKNTQYFVTKQKPKNNVQSK